MEGEGGGCFDILVVFAKALLFSIIIGVPISLLILYIIRIFT